ncbi:MAG: DUF3858 domain-containing protein, partial [Saprospiraceae bacterium]|nr:DUF3858 domain-containing protein [Saprospiraceae bacterium]
IYLSPILYSEFNENLFKLKERLYPVDIPYPFLEQITLNLQLPADYELESLPKMVMNSATTGGASYFFSSTNKGNGAIQLSSSLNISKQKFQPAEYPELKALFETMIQKKEEMLVLKKKV